MGALGKEGQQTPGRVLRVGKISLDLTARQLEVGGEVSSLTPKEAKLLWCLLTHPGQVLTRKQLMKQVWETDYVGDTRTLDVHVHWLRKRLQDTRPPYRYIHTVRRQGYRFEDVAAGASERDASSGTAATEP